MVSVSGARQFVTALRSEVQPTLGRQWPRHLTTDGQPCPEQLTQKPLAGLFGTHTTRPISHSHLTKRPAVARATAGKVLAGGCTRQGQSTRRGLSSPSMRGITSITWSVGRYSWPSCSSNGQSGHHPRPSRPDLALSTEIACARRAHGVEGDGAAEACSSAPQAACLTTLVTIRPLLGVSDPWHQISNLGPRKALKFGELQPSGRRGWWRSDALAGRHGGWSRLSAWFGEFRRPWERARRPGRRHVHRRATLPRTSARAPPRG